MIEKEGRQPAANGGKEDGEDNQKRLGPSSTQTGDARTKEAQDETRRAQVVQPEKLAQLEQFERTIHPAIADAYNNLGAILAGSRDYTGAVRYFQSASAWIASLEGI